MTRVPFSAGRADQPFSFDALTLSDFIDTVASRFGPNEALVFDDPARGHEVARWTYADLHRHARSVAAGLQVLEVARGDAVGILMGNRPEAVASLFGVALTGGIAVPLSTFAPVPELEYMLDRAGVEVVLTQERLLSRRFADELSPLGLRHLVAAGTPTWEAFLGDEPERADTSPDDDGLVIFSSGTTSAPKGVLHSHRATTLQFWVQSHIFGRHEQTRMWSSLPMFWTAGLNTAMGSTLAAGGCWVMQETFEPGEALALMARERVTEPYTLPHQTGALEEHPDWATTDLSSLTCVYGKSAFARHPSVQGDPAWRMPVGYGLTETGAFFSAHWWNTPRDVMAQSMGRPLPGNEVRVIDPDTGRALGVGETGELDHQGTDLDEGLSGGAP